MSTPTTEHALPQPTPSRFVGNLFDIDKKAPVQSLMALAREYGPIFSLQLPGRRALLVSGHELVNELCDEQRFDKLVHAPLRNVRAFTGDGLFTASTHEPNWRKAHNILLPNFGMRAMQGYMPAMIDLAEQLVQKWERLSPDEVINVPDDMTRLTLDTIGLCGFDYRFNSFYREESHPFIQAMVRALGESMSRTNRLPAQDKLMVRAHRQYARDIAFMNRTVDTIIQERKRSGDTSKQDLLSYMLSGVDKQTGEGLDDVNIRYQIITFLIAGHETTSGLLSFALYFLLKNPDVLQKAYAEVDRVLGADVNTKPTYAQVHRLTYVQQILKEALRLWPTAPAFAVYPYEDTTLGGKYQLAAGDAVQVLIPMLHRDPTVWGDDAETFNPDRFSPERERALPANAYKPFGNGQRACIGRQFALQEATLVLGMILQRFELIDYANYQLEVKETLTLKPHDFTMKVRPRTQRTIIATDITEITEKLFDRNTASVPSVSSVANHQTPLLVLYGSNLGTAEGVAQEIADGATARGFATTIAPLDEHVGDLPTEGAVIIISSSYNGLPPDNAVAFCRWLQSGQLAPDALKHVRYAVFGCGDRNWAATFQAVPTLIDEQLAAHGAQRIYARGEGDAADDFDGQFRAWAEPLWGGLAHAFNLESGMAEIAPQTSMYEVELVTNQASNPFVAAYGAQSMTVLANRELQTTEGPNCSDRSTRHIELALPEGMRYQTGDHLGVLPRNNADMVRRVLARFRLDGEAQVIIRRNGAGKSHLPLNQPVALTDLLSNYVELQDTATRAQLAKLAEHTECPPHKLQLLAMADESTYRSAVFDRHIALLDLLERYPACELPFNAFLEMLPPLRPRYYSISSSPMLHAHDASITVGVVDAPARSVSGAYKGVASNFLAQQPQGSAVYGFIRSPNVPFRPPTDTRTPMIMVGPGTGLAPFRGFLQERAVLKAQGAEVGPSLLFFGCRHPQQDFIYAHELRQYDAEGIAKLIPAFSRVEGQPKTYVQNNIKAHADEAWRLIEQGAVVYICGDASRMAPDVRATLAAIYREKTGGSADAAEAWLRNLAAQGRYLTDVWAS
jgi:cytochrome P450/NADPH-cytochrome P450 reductase